MTDRRSRRFPSEPKRWVSSHQTDLLYEDFSNRVVPYRSDPKAYELSTVGAHDYQVNESLTVGNHWHGLDGFLRAVACRLLTNQEVWLEVTFDNDDRNGAPFAVFEVDNVTRTKTGDLIQKLPGRDELPNSFQGRHEWVPEIELDAGRMIHVLLPDAYSSKLLMRVVDDLAEIDPNITPAWVTEQWSGQRRDAPPFDLSEAYRTERLRIAQAARSIGWTARGGLRQFHPPDGRVLLPLARAQISPLSVFNARMRRRGAAPDPGARERGMRFHSVSNSSRGPHSTPSPKIDAAIRGRPSPPLRSE